MIVQFSASESNIEKEIDVFRQIVQVVRDNDCELALDWVEEAFQASKNAIRKNKDSRDWQTIHRRIIDSIKRADLCIYEASQKSFSIGFQTAMALQLKKPILVLTKNDSLRDSFGSGIVSDLLVYKKYDEKDLSAIITNFIEENRFEVQDLRFNFVIDKDIHNYLRWAAFNGNTTKAEVVRKLLRSKIKDSNGL